MNVNMSNRELMLTLGRAARQAAGILALAPTQQKNEALKAMAEQARPHMPPLPPLPPLGR